MLQNIAELCEWLVKKRSLWRLAYFIINDILYIINLFIQNSQYRKLCRWRTHCFPTNGQMNPPFAPQVSRDFHASAWNCSQPCKDPPTHRKSLQDLDLGRTECERAAQSSLILSKTFSLRFGVFNPCLSRYERGSRKGFVLERAFPPQTEVVASTASTCLNRKA